MGKGVRSAILILLAVVAWAAKASPKALPPVQLSALFKKVLLAEDYVEEGNWAAAANTAHALGLHFKEVQKLVSDTVKPESLDAFRKVLAEFCDAVRSMDLGSALERHGEMQGAFLSIMEDFEFSTPPVLLMANNYVRIAAEAVERNRLSVTHNKEGGIPGFNNSNLFANSNLNEPI